VVNRRQVLMGSAAAGAALMSRCFKRHSPWEFLSDEQARTLTALCDRIIPADDFPSASQAGAVAFIDRQLVRHSEVHQTAYREGLRLADEMSTSLFGTDPASISELQQLVVAEALEKKAPEFFELVRRHTLQSYYGSPRHGGNRDAVSWRMLGLAEPPLRGRAQHDLTQSGPTQHELTAGSKP
jgi:gluconate 2-dehydrogenase gamma chain